MEQNGADVAVKVAGQEINLRNVKSLNTLLTASCAFGIGLLLWIAFTDRNDVKYALREISTAMQAQNAIGRESNCLNKFPEQERKINADWCKQVSGSR